MSYQIVGFTIYVKPNDVEHIDMDVENAMQLILTGGFSNTKRQEERCSRERLRQVIQ